MSPADASPLVFEVCAGSLAALEAALAAGAARVELCAGLSLGGLTPSLGAIRSAVARCARRARLHVLIRPRPGDYVYSPGEVEVMEADVVLAKAAGADGVVIGALDQRARVDVATCRRLVALARPLSVTFHRAFDATSDPLASLAEVAALGVDRLLSSGGAADALAGADVLAELVRRAGDELVVMAGGGITEANVADVVRRAKVRELHFSGRPASSGGAPSMPDRLAARLEAIMASARRGDDAERGGRVGAPLVGPAGGQDAKGPTWAS
ncbi:MAG: copper homeostasis protein CutC [Actinomycetota bacterium]|nr:copper homeostasis protein CutC [Actinomycetota bacterium]